MHRYGQYCPIAQALDILGDRWTLLVIRDLLTGTRHFNHLERGLPGISRGLLAQRLRLLQQMGIVEKRETPEARHTTEYRLTQAGQELKVVVDALLMWGARWAFREPAPDELDPLLLMWWMRGRVNADRLPRDRIVVQYHFHGAQSGTYWLLLSPTDVSICLTHPGFDVDVFVTADLADFFQLWLGRIDYHEALESRDIRVEGLPALVRAFPTWFAWSPAAAAVSAVRKQMGAGRNRS